MDRSGHFWYSNKQRETRVSHEPGRGWNYALINGKRVRYTEWTKTKKLSSTLDDVIYLGCGEYAGYE